MLIQCIVSSPHFAIGMALTQDITGDLADVQIASKVSERMLIVTTRQVSIPQPTISKALKGLITLLLCLFQQVFVVLDGLVRV